MKYPRKCFSKLMVLISMRKNSGFPVIIINYIKVVNCYVVAFDCNHVRRFELTMSLSKTVQVHLQAWGMHMVAMSGNRPGYAESIITPDV